MCTAGLAIYKAMRTVQARYASQTFACPDMCFGGTPNHQAGPPHFHWKSGISLS